MAETQPSIVVEYKNKRPIELLDLTLSLSAFGEEFKSFVTEKIEGGAPKLFIHQIRAGSIITELVPWLDQVDMLLKHRDEIAMFMASWEETLRGILGLTETARNLPKERLRNARSFVQPVAKDNGSQLNIIANDSAQVAVNVFNIRSDEAETIVKNAGYLLARSVPTEESFNSEPLTLYQLRDARAGDMGFIDRFSQKPVKLTFASEETKLAILHHSDNPWDSVFFVSGTVKTSGGAVVAYHIRTLDDVAPKDAA